MSSVEVPLAELEAKQGRTHRTRRPDFGSDLGVYCFRCVSGLKLSQGHPLNPNAIYHVPRCWLVTLAPQVTIFWRVFSTCPLHDP